MNKPKILLVDDINLSLEMGKVALSSSGATILTASNGCEALEIVKSENPDIVLSDIFMPEMNGDELCKTIKADPSLKHIPVILFSSYLVDKKTNDQCIIQSGCDDVLVKPFRKSEVLAMVSKYVNIVTREHKRVPVDIEVDYLDNGKTVSGKVIDMSVGGMLVKSPNTFPLNTDITFTVFIDGHDNGIPAMGRVVRSDKQCMGIQFLFAPNHIENFLAKVD